MNKIINKYYFKIFLIILFCIISLKCFCQDTLVKKSEISSNIIYEKIIKINHSSLIFSIDTLNNEFIFKKGNSDVSNLSSGKFVKNGNNSLLINDKKVWFNYSGINDFKKYIVGNIVYDMSDYNIKFINNKVVIDRIKFFKNEEDYWINKFQLKFNGGSRKDLVKIEPLIENDEILNVINGIVVDIDINDRGLATIMILHGQLYSVVIDLKICYIKKGDLVKANDKIGLVTDSTSHHLFGFGLIKQD